MLTEALPAEQSPTLEGLAVHGFGPLRRPLQGEVAAHQCATRARDPLAKRAVGQHTVERAGPGGGIERRHEEPRFSRGDEVRISARFVRMYVLQLGLLDGWRGALLCGFAALSVFLKYARLYELRQRVDA